MELIVSLIEADSTADSVSSRTLKAQDVSILPDPDRCEDTTERLFSDKGVHARASSAPCGRRSALCWRGGRAA
jgi:hypothetical protein